MAQSETPLTEHEEPVLLVGHTSQEHGVLREIYCGGPRPLACRFCKGERDCPYIEERSPLHLRVTYRAPTAPVPPLEHRTVATGSDGLPSDARHRVVFRAAAALGWSTAVGLLLWYWVIRPPTWQEAASVLGLKFAIFLFVVVGVPIVRLTWSHHGGWFRRRP